MVARSATTVPPRGSNSGLVRWSLVLVAALNLTAECRSAPFIIHTYNSERCGLASGRVSRHTVRLHSDGTSLTPEGRNDKANCSLYVHGCLERCQDCPHVRQRSRYTLIHRDGEDMGGLLRRHRSAGEQKTQGEECARPVHNYAFQPIAKSWRRSS